MHSNSQNLWTVCCSSEIAAHCKAEWNHKRRRKYFDAETLSFSSSTVSVPHSVTDRVPSNALRPSPWTLRDNVHCKIGVLDIPSKSMLSAASTPIQEALNGVHGMNEFNESNVIHIDWRQFVGDEQSASSLSECDNLYIRITRTIGQMPHQILADAADAIFMFAAWSPTPRPRRVYVAVDQSDTFRSPKRSKDSNANSKATTKSKSKTDRNMLPTPFSIDGVQSVDRGLDPMSMEQGADRDDVDGNEINEVMDSNVTEQENKGVAENQSKWKWIALVVGASFVVLSGTAVSMWWCIKNQRGCFKWKSFRGVSIMLTRHEMIEFVKD